ncbi:MAG: hypothetical protein K0B05_01585 [Bacteroidales bacterium]|nr:hypothetical protein [Bacteroidales bacterium]
MSVSKIQAEIAGYKVLEEKILRRISLITQVIQKLEDNEMVYAFFVPYIGPSQDQVYSLIGPDLKALNNELVHFRIMWRNVHKHIEELKFRQFKEYTNEDIEKFHRRAKSELNKATQRMIKGSSDDCQKLSEELLVESDRIILSLCKLVRRDPTKENMKRLLSELTHNIGLGGGNSVDNAFKTLNIVVLQRLRYANNNYGAETNQRDYVKLIEAFTDAQLLMTEHDAPLMQQVAERINRISMAEAHKDRRRRSEGMD